MDSFEINKILGAVLATCLVLLITSFTANALFAPKAPAKPGFEIAAKEEGGKGGEAKPRGAPRGADREAAGVSLCREGASAREGLPALPHLREGRSQPRRS